MKEQLSKLLAAQKIDLEIDQLERSREDYPREIELLKKEIVDFETELSETDAAIAENEKSRRLIEEEIAAERDTQKKKEARLIETKTNKEYTAVQHEIVAARERVDSLETEDLELMTAMDELTPKQQELTDRLAEIRKNNETAIAEIQHKFDSIESDVAKLDRSRERTLKGIDSRSNSVYTRLRKGKGGIAVVTVDPVKLTCRGCHKKLPHQKVLEIRRSERLIFCESCGRVLAWDQSED